MTTEQFRDCFVGEKGYEALKRSMKNGNDLTIDIAKCWQERYDLEMAYAKGLRKNSETFQKLSARAKGSLVQALNTISTQTNVESEAHQLLATTLSNKISTPMKNLADTQLKARKPYEDILNGKFKAWRDQKDVDTKYRQRQFEKCKEIESLYLKMDEIPKTTKNSVKEVSKDIPMVTTCIFASGRQTVTMTEKIESSLQKLEQELEKTEKKYHDATKEVELTRQLCDVEMCRCSDYMQSMEIDRISEMEKFIQTYTNAIQILSDTMNHIQQDLSSIRITPQDDIITLGKQNLQTTETEILLYDIYAENDRNTMSQERRVLSLMHWMQMLRQDIEIQRRSKDDTMVKTDHQRDGSSSGSNVDDEDGAMRRHHHHRKEKKREGIETLQGFCKQNQKFSTGVDSNEIFVNRQSIRLLQCLYEGSLYKLEKIYNSLKHLPEPQYEYSQRFAKSYTDKGIPTTLLRVPYQPLAHGSAPVPSPMVHLARSAPILAAQQPMAPPPPPPYPAANQTPIGWAITDVHSDHSALDNRSAPSSCPYPVLPSPSSSSVMTSSTDSLRSGSGVKRVHVLHAYDAQHDDELTIRPGDVITLIERRSDQWCKGSLRGTIGLFPGNFVQEL